MKPPAGGITAREPMVTTRPRPAAVIRGTAARAAVKVAVRLSVSMRSHVARSVSRRPPPAMARLERVDEIADGSLVGDVGPHEEQPVFRGGVDARLEPIALGIHDERRRDGGAFGE